MKRDAERVRGKDKKLAEAVDASLEVVKHIKERIET